MAKNKNLWIRVKKWFTENRVATIVIPLLTIVAGIFGSLLPGWLEKPKTFLPNPLLDQSELALVEENYPKAIQKAGEAKAVEPDNPRIYFVLYAALELSDRHEEAVQTLQEGAKQVKKRATGGKEIRATLKAAETSPEEGLAAVAESYQGFDELKSLALRFLQLLVKVFEGNERFERMLAEVGLDVAATKSDVAHFGDSVYQVFDLGMTWYEAKAYCESIGGYLATITSPEEQSFAEDLITDYGKNIYWLGGTDEAQEGLWKWVTGEAFEFSNWYGNGWQPDNNNRTEHYLHVFGKSHPDYYDIAGGSAGKWNDLCYDANGYNDGFYSLENTGFICEWSTAD